MKNIVIALFLLPMVANAQTASPDDEAIVWYGLDFTKAKLIGSEGFTNPKDILNRYLESWNNVIVNEADKYNLKKFFRKVDVAYDLEPVMARNETITTDGLVTNKSHSITKSDVEAAVRKYKKGAHASGLGLVFVIESFNKKKEKGHMWVTYFDIASGKVLKTTKMEGKAGGFGLRNYWVKSVFNVMKRYKKYD